MDTVQKVWQFVHTLDSVFAEILKKTHIDTWNQLLNEQLDTTECIEMKNHIIKDSSIFHSLRKGLLLCADEPELSHQIERYFIYFLYHRIELDERIAGIKEQAQEISEQFCYHRDYNEYHTVDIMKSLLCEPDVNRRKEAARGLSELNKQLTPLMKELGALRNSFAQEAGFSHYGQLLLAKQDIDEKQWLKFVSDFLRVTNVAQEQFLLDLKQFLTIEEVESSDLMFGMYHIHNAIDHYYLWEILFNTLDRSCELLGVPLQPQKLARKILDEPHPELPRMSILLDENTTPRIFCQASGGLRFYKALYQYFGELFLWAGKGYPLFVGHELESGCFRKALGRIFASVLHEPAWLSSVLEVTEQNRQLILNTRKFQIQPLRTVSFAASVEFLCYAEQRKWESGCHRIFEECMLIPTKDASFLTPLNRFIQTPGDVIEDFLADIISLQALLYLRSQFGTLLDQSVGALLYDTWIERSRVSSWQLRYQQLTSSPFTVEGIESEFGYN